MKALQSWLLLTALLGLPSTASSLPGSYPSQASHSCGGHIKTSRGEIMIGDYLIAADGSLVQFRGTWRPPSEELVKPDGFEIPQLLLGVEYRETKSGPDSFIVEPWKYRVTVSLFPPSGRPVDPARQKRKIARYKLSYHYDNGPPVVAKLIPQQLDPNWMGLIEAAAILPDPPVGAQTLTIRLSNVKGVMVSGLRYAVGDTDGRQALLNQARSAFLDMTRKPTECWPIQR